MDPAHSVPDAEPQCEDRHTRCLTQRNVDSDLREYLQALRKDVGAWSGLTSAWHTTYSGIRVLTRTHLQMRTINKEEEEMRTEMPLCHHLEVHPLKIKATIAGSEQHPMRQTTQVEETIRQPMARVEYYPHP